MKKLLTGKKTDRPPRPAKPGWRERAKLRRRLRYLRRLRELAMRDLGGLIFDMYRFGSKRQDLVREKLNVMFSADNELYSLETVLNDHQRLHELRIPGVGGTCPECGTLHSSDARFCSNCAEPLTPALRAAAAEPAATAQQPVASEDHHDHYDEAQTASPAQPEFVAEELYDEEEEFVDEDDFDEEEYDDAEFDELRADDLDEEIVEHHPGNGTTHGVVEHPTVSFNAPVPADAEPQPAASPNGQAEQSPRAMSAGDPLGSGEPGADGSQLAAGDPLARRGEEPRQ